MRTTFLTVLALALGLALAPAPVAAQGDLFSPDYLTGGSTRPNAGSAPSFDEYMNSLSFDRWLTNQGNQPTNGGNQGTTTGGGGLDGGTTGPTTGQPGTTGNTGSQPGTGVPTAGGSVDLLGQGVGSYPNTPQNPGLYTNQDAVYWRPTSFGGTQAGQVNIHTQPYGPSPDATIKAEPWSYVWWPMRDCSLAFMRTPVVDPSTVTDPAQRARNAHCLSAMEAFDTYVYNKTGVNPCTASWEANPDHHNKMPLCYRRESPESEAKKLYWIVSESPESLGSVSPLAGYAWKEPTAAEGSGPWTSEVTVGGRKVQASRRLILFLGQFAEEITVPYDAVKNDSRFAVQTNVQCTIDGQRSSWDQRHMLDQRADDPTWARFFRVIGATYRADGSPDLRPAETKCWYFMQYTLKAGVSEFSWWGHCNGFSAASLKVPLPKAFPIVKKFTGGGVKLLRLKLREAVDATPGTLKGTMDDYEVVPTTSQELRLGPPHYFGVASETWFICNTDIRNSRPDFYTNPNPLDVTGNSYDGATGNTALDEKLFKDIYPHNLMVLLMDFVKERRLGLVCDKVASATKYNAPVRAFKFQHTFQQEATGAADANAKRWYNLTLWLDYVPYGNFTLQDFVVRNQFPAGWAQYEAKLYLDRSGRICDGEWVGASANNHPDFVWVPLANPEGSKTENPLDENFNMKETQANEFLSLDEGSIAVRTR